MGLDHIVNTLFNVHPVHTQLVHFPIALTTTGLLFVVLALLRKNIHLEHAAFYCMTLVALSSVGAGLSGFRDQLVRYDGGAPLVPTKIFLAASLFVLATVVVVSRRRSRRLALWQGSSVVLYVAAFAAAFLLAAVLGFLGGVIIYGY